MSARFLERSSPPDTATSNFVSPVPPGSTEDEEWQLKVAVELSVKSFEMEQEKRRSCFGSDNGDGRVQNDVPRGSNYQDLIDLDDPVLAERKKKINEIKELQRQMVQSNSSRVTAPPIGSLPSSVHSSFSCAPSFLHGWRTTISGGRGDYGIAKTSSTPNFTPYVNRSVLRNVSTSTFYCEQTAENNESRESSVETIQWRTNPKVEEPPFRFQPSSKSTRTNAGAAAVYWRRNNNLVIPYVKSTVFGEKTSDDDSLIQFLPPDSTVESLSSEELLRIFDPLFSKPATAETASADKHCASRAAEASQAAASTASEARSKSSVGELENTAKDVTKRTDNADRKAENARPRSYQQATSTVTITWNDIRLTDRTSDLERQAKLLHDGVVKSLASDQAETVWRDVIIARRVSYPMPSATDVMLVIHSNSANGLLKFTCAVSSSVDQVLQMVLFNSDLQLQQQSFYALKVFGRDEYLLPQSSLSDYAYVHNSIKLGKDIILQLAAAPKQKDKRVPAYRQCLTSECFRSVVKKDIELVLETIKTEIRRVQDTVRSGGAPQCTPAIQAIKALCSLMYNVEPVELCVAINRFLSVCESLVSANAAYRRDSSGASEGVKSSAVDASDLDRAIGLLATAVHGLLSSYCYSSNASFAPVSVVRRPSSDGELKEFVHLEDTFSFYVGSFHNLPPEWMNRYAKFYVSAYVFHGVQEIMKKERAALAFKEHGLYPYLKVDCCIRFDNSRLCTLPREARACVVLYGVHLETGVETSSSHATKSIVEVQIGWGCIPVFDSNNCLIQGPYLVPIMLDATIQPWGSPSYVGEFCRHLPILAVTLPKFDREVRFPDCVPLAPFRSSCTFDQLDLDTREALEGIFDTAANAKELARDEKDLLWEMRLYLTKKPEALPLVLASAFSWDCLFLSHIYQLLKVWTNLETAQAIELLLPKFPDKEVRKYALRCMRKSGADELLGYLPQLVEALQFELYEDSSLAHLLLHFASENRRFAFALFWLLEERKGRSLYGCRCHLLQKILLYLLDESVSSEIKDQLRMIERTDNVAVDLKSAKEGDREATLRANLEILDSSLLDTHVRLPLNPSVIAVGIDIAKSTYYNSITVPMKIVYRSLNSSFEVLHKVGDDLRQDALVMQMIRLMNDVWLNEGLDLRIVTFHCLPTGRCRGMIEMVPQSKTLREIHTEEGGGVSGVLREDLTRRWIQKHNPCELDYEMALKNFRLSCAGWCVATYVLGIGDRHNDNILVTSHGHMLHIDFGKYLGDTQTIGGFRRDRTPFLLSNDMVYVINAGETKATAYFQEFVDNCCLAFNILRKHCGLFVNLMKLMVCSGIPGLTMDAVEYISQNFCMGYSESKASEYFTRMIEETMKSSFPKWNFLVHALAQQRKPAPVSNSEQLLSFVPTRYTEQTDGRILCVDVVECQKWRIPEKVYMYKLQVIREHVTDPYYIYRSYKEFCEFCDLLLLRFPLAKLYSLSRLNLGRTNIREVAERRRLEIAAFLETMFRSDAEVTHSDIVYTFFHSLYRDQETDDSARDGISNDGNGTGVASTEVRGNVRVALEYRQGNLEVFVSHVRDLSLNIGGAAPDVYVKCYLRPGHSTEFKRKTRVVQKSLNPTFNETLEYKLPLSFFNGKQLEVTVWRRDVLKENAFLGGALIPLDEVVRTPGRKLARWYALENIHSGRW